MVLQIMRERGFVRRDAVLLAIPGRLEMRAGTTAFDFAELGIVQQRLQIGFLHIRIRRGIPYRVENRIWSPPFLVTVKEEMLERIGAYRCDVRIRTGIIGLIEQTNLLQETTRRLRWHNFDGSRKHLRACGGAVVLDEKRISLGLIFDKTAALCLGVFLT